MSSASNLALTVTADSTCAPQTHINVTGSISCPCTITNRARCLPGRCCLPRLHSGWMQLQPPPEVVRLGTSPRSLSAATQESAETACDVNLLSVSALSKPLSLQKHPAKPVSINCARTFDDIPGEREDSTRAPTAANRLLRARVAPVRDSR